MYLERWIENMGLGRANEPPIEVSGGLLHKMYMVSTAMDKYAVKVLNAEIMKRPQALQNTINSEKISYIMSTDIPVVSSIMVSNRQIHMQDGYYFMVFPWLEGRSVYAPEISIRHCQIIGDILGRIHRLNISFNGMEFDVANNNLYDWKKLQEIASEKASDAEWYSCFQKAMDDIEKWNGEANAAYAYLKQNRVISHRDLDPKNVMWNGMQAYIIDWESAGYINPYQELLEVINYWATDEKGQLTKSYFDALTEAYKAHINLDNVEWDGVFAGSFTGMLGWLEYNAKRAVGLEVADIKETVVGAKHVINTIDELYSYQEKLKLIREWM